MTMNPPREKIAIAVDGGGLKGLLVAEALQALEQALSVNRLLDDPRLRVLAGTSTGAIITAGIAIGMSATEIVRLYRELAPTLFPLAPILPYKTQRLIGGILGLFRPAQFARQPLEAALRTAIKQQTGQSQITMKQLRERMGAGRSVIITIADVYNRRTRFIKSSDPNDDDWDLAEAVIGSAAAPTYLPVLERDSKYLVDGAIGAYSNPASVAAKEITRYLGNPPDTVSLFSFGTGWIDESQFAKAKGRADWWNNLTWAANLPTIILGDATRAQSLELYSDYVETGKMDWRRFQILFETDIDVIDSREETLQKLTSYGQQIAARIHANQFAPNEDATLDPEGLAVLINRYEQSIRRVRNESG